VATAPGAPPEAGIAFDVWNAACVQRVPPDWVIKVHPAIEPGHIMVCAPLGTGIGLMTVRPNDVPHANRLLYALSAALITGVGDV